MWKQQPNIIKTEFTLPANHEDTRDLTQHLINVRVNNNTKIPIKAYVTLTILEQRPVMYIEICEEVKK